VGHTVAVNIDICVYLQFFSINFVSIIWVQYATDNLSGQERVLLHRPVLIFQPTVNARASDIESERVRTVLVSWEKCAVTNCLRIYWCFWRGLGSGGGTFWLLNECLTFMSPDA